MKQSLLSVIILLVCVLGLSAQVEKKHSLIIASCKKTGRTCDTQEVFRYDFTDGELVSKENLITTKVEDVRFDLGGNFIHQNRYLINEFGAILDLQTKQFIIKDAGNFIMTIGDDVIYEVRGNLDKAESLISVYVFNLKTRKYEKIDDFGVLQRKDAILSPDKKCLAVSEEGKGSQKDLVVYELEGLKVKNKQVIEAVLPLRTDYNHFDWLDNENFIVFTDDHKIIKINVSGKKETIVKIPVKEKLLDLRYPNRKRIFSKDNGKVIYQTDDQDFVVDLKRKIYTTGLLPIKNGFEKRYEKTYWVVFYHQGKPIGKTMSTGWSLPTEDYLVVEYTNFIKKGDFFSIADGVKVWSKTKRKWTIIPINWNPMVAGWIEN